MEQIRNERHSTLEVRALNVNRETGPPEKNIDSL